MRINIFLILTILLSSCSTLKNVKKQTDSNLLQDKMWVMQEDFEKIELTRFYLKDKVTTSVSIKSSDGKWHNEEPCEYSYYLSDSIEQSFDFTKVGGNKNGKYIIEKREEKISIYEIQELTDDTLILKAIHKPDEIWVGGGSVTYKKQKSRK